jgi:hypothetical protein
MLLLSSVVHIALIVVYWAFSVQGYLPGRVLALTGGLLGLADHSPSH